MANLQAIQNSLIKIGLPENNIISICREDPFLDPRNIKNEVILQSEFDEADSNTTDAIDTTNTFNTTNIVNKLHTSLANPLANFPHKTSIHENLSDQFILNLLNLRHKALYDLSENDNIFIYLCGHATTDFFKIVDRFFLFTEDITDALNYLSKRLKNVVLILDTCKAGSLINKSRISFKNMMVITSSNEVEFSYSSIHDHTLGIACVDDFVSHIAKNGIDTDLTFKEYFNKMKLKSTVECIGNDMKISTFFAQNNASENYIPHKFIF